MNTRPGNNKCPGEVVKSSARCPTAVVQEKSAAKAAEKEKAAAANDAAVQKLVQFENNARKKVMVAEAEVVRPSLVARKANYVIDEGKQLPSINFKYPLTESLAANDDQGDGGEAEAAFEGHNGETPCPTVVLKRN
jgi:hypothetical protein